MTALLAFIRCKTVQRSHSDQVVLAQLAASKARVLAQRKGAA